MKDRTPLPKQCFIDSNIWLYALNKRQDEHKHAVANQLVRAKGFIVSTQVINEVCSNLVKKASFSQAQTVVVVKAFYQRCHVISFDRDILLKAGALREQYQISFWDSLIVSSALSTEAKILYSEDMNSSLVIEKKLTIINPLSV